jgi:hypothetical protein
MSAIPLPPWAIGALFAGYNAFLNHSSFTLIYLV